MGSWNSLIETESEKAIRFIETEAWIPMRQRHPHNTSQRDPLRRARARVFMRRRPRLHCYSCADCPELTHGRSWCHLTSCRKTLVTGPSFPPIHRSPPRSSSFQLVCPPSPPPIPSFALFLPLIPPLSSPAAKHGDANDAC